MVGRENRDSLSGTKMSLPHFWCLEWEWALRLDLEKDDEEQESGVRSQNKAPFSVNQNCCHIFLYYPSESGYDLGEHDILFGNTE